VDLRNGESEMHITQEYIAQLLNARGYKTDPETVKAAYQAWIYNLEQEEDNHFITVLENAGIVLQETEE
jgi:hypothetical protein